MIFSVLGMLCLLAISTASFAGNGNDSTAVEKSLTCNFFQVNPPSNIIVCSGTCNSTICNRSCSNTLQIATDCVGTVNWTVTNTNNGCTYNGTGSTITFQIWGSAGDNISVHVYTTVSPCCGTSGPTWNYTAVACQ